MHVGLGLKIVRDSSNKKKQQQQINVIPAFKHYTLGASSDVAKTSLSKQIWSNKLLATHQVFAAYAASEGSDETAHMLKPSSYRSPYIFTLVQKVKHRVYKIHVF